MLPQGATQGQSGGRPLRRWCTVERDGPAATTRKTTVPGGATVERAGGDVATGSSVHPRGGGHRPYWVGLRPVEPSGGEAAAVPSTPASGQAEGSAIEDQDPGPSPPAITGRVRALPTEVLPSRDGLKVAFGLERGNWCVIAAVRSGARRVSLSCRRTTTPRAEEPCKGAAGRPIFAAPVTSRATPSSPLKQPSRAILVTQLSTLGLLLKRVDRIASREPSAHPGSIAVTGPVTPAARFRLADGGRPNWAVTSTDAPKPVVKATVAMDGAYASPRLVAS